VNKKHNSIGRLIMPTIEIAGKQIETTEMGYLVNAEDWSEDLAKAIASQEKLDLTDKHWDVINHLRDEFFNNAGNQPNTRKLVKFFEKLWGEKIDAKVLYDLFPGDPSKQGGRISGLPESRRKGGY
jgi:tRNA 2-thiouridine synthesizing protein E